MMSSPKTTKRSISSLPGFRNRFGIVQSRRNDFSHKSYSTCSELVRPLDFLKRIEAPLPFAKVITAPLPSKCGVSLSDPSSGEERRGACSPGADEFVDAAVLGQAG